MSPPRPSKRTATKRSAPDSDTKRARTADDGRRRQLSEDEIISGALALTKRVGVDGLTMRALADELGVTPMAAYYYLPNKQALIDLVANAVLDRATLPGPETGTWDERLYTLIRQVMRELVQYPGLGEYLETSELTPAGRRQMEESLALLEEAGFRPADARRVYSTIYTYMYGRVMFQSFAATRPGPRGSSRRRPKGVLTLEELASEAHAEFGYRVVVAGVRALLAP